MHSTTDAEKLDYVIVAFDPSWHQVKAHGVGTFSSLMFLQLTKEEAEKRSSKLRPKEYLWSRTERPDWWEKYAKKDEQRTD